MKKRKVNQRGLLIVIIAGLMILLVIVLLIWLIVSLLQPKQTETVQVAEQTVQQTPASTHQIEHNEIGTYADGVLIVNKKNPISSDYAPGNDPEAEAAVRQMIADLQAQGYAVSDYYSGFRTYEEQASLYNSYAAENGTEAADTYSARPGYSEHQTGLTFDLVGTDGQLITDDETSQWILDNAPNYGFIVRYPKGKEDVTGYIAEPWHLRYLGTDLAQAVSGQGVTLEEYFGVEGGDYADSTGQNDQTDTGAVSPQQ